MTDYDVYVYGLSLILIDGKCIEPAYHDIIYEYPLYGNFERLEFQLWWLSRIFLLNIKQTYLK